MKTNTLERQKVALLEEIKKREEHPFTNWKPAQDGQAEYKKSSAYIRMLLGGNRSGKSNCAAHDCVQHLRGQHPYRSNYKRPRIWCLSQEYRTLYEGLWNHIQRFIPSWWIEKRSANIPNWNMPMYVQLKDQYGGGRVDFISAQGGEDARRKLQAAAVDEMYIDEEFDESILIEIQMRLLDSGGRINFSGTLVRSDEYILDLENAAEGGDDRVEVFRLDTRKNQYINQEAVKKIMSHLSDDDKQVRIEGRSRRHSGKVYKEWGQKNVRSLDLSNPEYKDWPRFVALDPGFRTFAGLWATLSPKGEVYLYREMYLHETKLKDVATFIKEAEKEDQARTDGKFPEYHLIDPSGFAHLEDGEEGIAIQLMRDFQIQCIPAIKGDGAIEIVRTWIEEPVVFVDKKLENFIWEMSRYRIRPRNHTARGDAGADRPMRKDNHLMDCLKYLAAHIRSYEYGDEEVVVWKDANIDRVKILRSDNERMRRDKWKSSRERQKNFSYT